MGCLHLFNIVLFLGVFVLSREAKIILPVGCKYDFCSYTGDPHLTPFSQPYVYWCQKPGWELLLSNQYVTIYVLVDAASFYAIIDYVLVFPGPPSCTTFGSSTNAWPCIGWASPVWTFTPGTTRIYFHKTQCLIIKIVKTGPYFHFYIWQSPTLVGKSCGVCVKWDCKPECHWINPSPAVPRICEQFVQAANKRRNADNGDNERIDSIRKSCVNDIQTTLNLDNGRIAAITVLQGDLEELLVKHDPETAVRILDQAEQGAIEEASKEVDVILRESEKVCNDERCLSPEEKTASTEGLTSDTRTDSTGRTAVTNSVVIKNSVDITESISIRRQKK